MTGRSLRRSGVAIVQLAALGGIVFLTAGPAAQGLGDVAKKEAERRQQVSAGKRYTNTDLPADSGSAPVAAPATSAQVTTPSAKPEVSDKAGASPADGSKTSPSPAGETTPPPQQTRDENYWRGRAKDLRSRVQQLQEQVKALGGRLDDLGVQLERGAGRSTVGEQEVTRRSLTKAQEDLQSIQGEWDRFQTRARALKIPEDWLQ